MLRLSYFFVASFVFLISCNEKKREIKNDNFIVIDIQPFIGISNAKVTYVVNELSKVYPHLTVKSAIQLPKSAYFPERKRYRADSLINFLNSRTQENHVTIGLTDSDISTTKDSISDWGIMGLGFCPGKACVASTFRLSKTETNMQLFKVSIHEIGHTQGLQHCSIKSCFMRDAEGRNPTNEEIEFCPKCRNHLQEKGWKLN